MTLEMKTFLEIQDEELQLYLKHTNNRIARLDSEVEQKAEEAEHLADFYTENGPVLTEEQRRAIYLKIEEWFGDMAKIDYEKVRLANMMYDTTAAHIARMDKHLHDFQKLQEKHRRTELQAAEGAVASPTAKSDAPSMPQAATRKRKEPADSGTHRNGERHDPEQSTTASEHGSEPEDVKPPWLVSRNVEQKAEEAERLAGFYTENRLVLTEEQQRAIYLKIEEWFGDMAKIDDEKVRLANMMYDTTVAHIERMDKHVHDFQKLQEKHRRTELQAAEGAAASSSTNNDAPSRSQETTRKEAEHADSEANGNGRQHDPAQSTSPSGHASANREPLYCVCRDVSYGDMVACDGKTCKIEWFHFDCVGMITPPDGEWYCPDCAEQMMKRRKRK